MRPWWMPSPLACVALALFFYLCASGIADDGLWPYHLSKAVISAGWENISTMEPAYRNGGFAALGLVFLGFYGFYWLVCKIPSAPVMPPPITTSADFRDNSPYGDAALADRDSIQRAMMGHNIPDAPQFEE